MSPCRRRRHWSLTLSLAGVLLFSSAGKVLASDQQSSKSGSSNSSDSNSSNGSNDSSNSSKGSSDHSQASSKDSNNSTQNSPKNTTDYTSKGTSDWSTNSRGGHVLSIALAVVVVGVSVGGTVALSRSQHDRQRQAALALAAYMRRQHALLTHDVALASGPVLEAWTHDLRLTPGDRLRFRAALEGSPEQGALLDALDGPIDERRAQRFAAIFMRVTERTIGPVRVRALVTEAGIPAGDG